MKPIAIVPMVFHAESFRYDDPYCAWQMTRLPGNGQVMVSHGSVVAPEWRKKGIGKAQHTIRLAEAKKRRTAYMICTVNSGNSVQIGLLVKAGWRMLAEFSSDCSVDDDGGGGFNQCEIWGKVP